MFASEVQLEQPRCRVALKLVRKHEGSVDWLRTQPAQSRQTSATTAAAAVIQAANLGARKIAATIAASQYANAAATSITTLMETTTSRWLVAVAYAAPSFAVINPIARAASAVVLAFQCWRLAALLS